LLQALEVVANKWCQILSIQHNRHGAVAAELVCITVLLYRHSCTIIEISVAYVAIQSMLQ